MPKRKTRPTAPVPDLTINWPEITYKDNLVRVEYEPNQIFLINVSPCLAGLTMMKYVDVFFSRTSSVTQNVLGLRNL